MQVNCFVLSLSTLLSNKFAAVGLHLKTRRSIAKQRRHCHEGLKFPWRRKSTPRDASVIRYATENIRLPCRHMLNNCASAFVSNQIWYHAHLLAYKMLHLACMHACKGLLHQTAPMLCRVISPELACKQAVEQGLAAEHAMDMRKAVLCFEVCLTQHPFIE